MQTNSFSTRASLTCSVARVPFRGTEFTGFIIGLLPDGQLYSFTTYNGSTLSEIEYDKSDCAVAEKACPEIISLPIFPETPFDDLEYIAWATKEAIATLKKG